MRGSWVGRIALAVPLPDRLVTVRGDKQRGAASLQLLWAHVPKRAHLPHVWVGQSLLPLPHLGDPEVHDPHRRLAARIFGEEEVRRLQVPVDDIVLMDERQGAE